MRNTQSVELQTPGLIPTERPLAALTVADIMALTPTEFALFLDGWREAADCRSPDDCGPCEYVNPHPEIAS